MGQRRRERGKRLKILPALSSEREREGVSEGARRGRGMQSDPARANDIELQKWGEDSVSCVKFHPSRCCRFAPVPCPNRCFSPSLSSCACAVLCCVSGAAGCAYCCSRCLCSIVALCPSRGQSAPHADLVSGGAATISPAHRGIIRVQSSATRCHRPQHCAHSPLRAPAHVQSISP